MVRCEVTEVFDVVSDVCNVSRSVAGELFMSGLVAL